MGVVHTVLSKKAYLVLFLALFASYTAVNIWLNQFADTIPVFFTFRLGFVIPYAIISVLTGVLAALNITLIIFKVKQVRSFKTDETSAAAIGLFGGMLGGACPGCFVGLLPSLAGVFGITVSLSSLPFLGFEIQIPTLLILLVTLLIVSSPLTCKVNIKK